MEKTIIALDNLSASNLPELQGFKEKQLQLVDECPYVEIIDNQSYELAKKHRTALLKGRTTLESQDKLIASKLTAFRKEVASVTKELIEITLVHEEKQQSEVKRYEAIKEAEKAEKERLENERIEKIKSTISDFESCSYDLISKMTFEKIKETKDSLDNYFSIDYDAQEFDILYQQAKNRIQNVFDVKCGELQEKENQRIENERLAREKAEADAKLKAIEEQQEKERLEREEKEREQKVKVFEVRKNRLAEIGFIFQEGLFSEPNFFVSKFTDKRIFEIEINNADVIDFENILTDAKKLIQEAKIEAEEIVAKEELKRLAEIEANKEFQKKNKERQKRLKIDKAIIKNGLEIYFAELDLFTENAETKEFIKNANNSIQDLKTELLTQLENL